MAKPKHAHLPLWAWRIHRASVYAKLSALGGMADHAKTKIKPLFAWQGKLNLEVGSYDYRSVNSTFEVKVAPSTSNHHRVSVRCPKCYAWVSFGKLHQHILSARCLATAEIAFRGKLPSIPALRCE